MPHTWKNAAQLEKCGTIGKMRHTGKYVPHLEKMRHTWKNEPN